MNNIIIKKFGGTSLNYLNRVACLIKNDVEKGYNVLVVVSAAACFTDQMVSQIKHISELHCKQELSEYDVVLSAGEQISCGLLAVKLNSMGVNAKSWLAWQLPIITDSFYSESRIKKIEINNLQKSFSEGYNVAIIAGFQGVCNNRITTFGRGGSDISAVALSVAFDVQSCEIFTDIDGIYTADPKIVPKARKLKYVSYDEMLEMSFSGAKILHNRSIQLAMKHSIKLKVLSTLRETEGTIVLPNQDILEKYLVTGITYSTNEAYITLPSANLHILKNIINENIKIDMIQNTSFIIAKCDIPKIKRLLNNYTINDNIAKISIIGIGVTSHAEVIRQLFKVLERNKLEILSISTSEIKISMIIEKEYSELLVRDLHTEYNLDCTSN